MRVSDNLPPGVCDADLYETDLICEYCGGEIKTGSTYYKHDGDCIHTKCVTDYALNVFEKEIAE